MKKLLTILLSLILCLSLGMFFTACEDDPDNPPPENPPSANQVTEEQFNSAISFNGVSSVTVNLEIVEGGQTETNVALFDGAKAKFSMTSGGETQTDFVEFKEGGADYYLYEGTTCYKMSLSATEAEEIQKLSDYKDVIFIGEYSEFTFENDEYKLTKEGTTLVAKFLDGKLISAVLTAEEGSASYTFTKYGSTTVTLPTDYTEVSGGGNGGPGTNPGAKAWEEYFDMQNVTVVAVDEDKYYFEGDLVSEDYSVSTWKLDGEKWSYRCESDGYNIYAIYDGEECLIDNEPYAEVATAKMMFVENSILSFLDEMISGEDMFNETGDNVYTLQMTSEGMTKTCVVTITNGYVSSIVYTIVGEDGDGYGGDLKTTYTFSNFGTTVVA